ncbi:PREDICTED: protein SLOW GREEN 1, chloroplastic [Theobroma cacao]|uniref:Protein SLOW GREEN 1, chloroplastic n=1 Tax=Theobroma cacao TaxID=3641 RepID=A0AB32VKB8_THECC|nr:PREDICTED: protein SLOW GREEN 1, chloroplastic [Theobroma cacao]
MNPTLATLSAPSPSFLRLKSLSSSTSSASFLAFPAPKPFRLRASSAKSDSFPSSNPNKHTQPLTQKLQCFAKTAILLGATALMIGKFSHFPAKAESPPTMTEQETSGLEDGEQQEEDAQNPEQTSPLSEFLGSNNEAIEALKYLLEQKLENGEDEEALTILNRLVSAQPQVTDWKFLLARLLSEMGQTENARKVFEEILRTNPLSFEALFENALLMDRCGEGEAVIKRLEEALTIAQDEKKVKEARDVRLIMAQIQFLQKNVEEALRSYQQLAKEDPSDFRPYFCQGMIYSLLDRNAEAKEQFAKYRELSPKKFEVEGYLRTSLSRMKLFGTNEN